MTGTLTLQLLIATVAALAGAAIAQRLRLSALTGYLLVGVVIGPFTPGWVADVASIEQLAELGVIFLMFVIGVQVSFRELMRASRIALVGGLAQVASTIALGIAVGRLLGWSWSESFAFGAVISNSSSTVLSKVLADRGELDREHARVGLAWSSVQDLSTVVLVAALALAAPGGERGPDPTWLTIGRALLFLLVVAPAALWALPRLFGAIAAIRNREVFVLSVTGIALSMAWISAQLGVSTALGAFIAGAIVGESDVAHRILGTALPFRDVFAGIFFVSIGMLFDPSFALRRWDLVLLTAALIIVGKGLITYGVARVAGAPRALGVWTALGLAQSAEFSFLMAGIASDLDVVGDDVLHAMVSGTGLTILAAPAVVGAAPWLVRKLGTALPERATSHAEPAAGALRDHVIVCGAGRVGSLVRTVLAREGAPVVVIDDDVRVVRRLQSEGARVVFGEADEPSVLERAGIATARALVCCVPGRSAVRGIVEHARALRPDLPVLVRTHDEHDRAELLERGATYALIGEIELGLELASYALGVLGVPARRVQQHLEIARGERSYPRRREA